jgi:hypothetical protein
MQGNGNLEHKMANHAQVPVDKSRLTNHSYMKKRKRIDTFTQSADKQNYNKKKRRLKRHLEQKPLYMKSLALQLVKKNGHNLQYLCNTFRNDKEIATVAMNENIYSFIHVGDALKRNAEFITNG